MGVRPLRLVLSRKSYVDIAVSHQAEPVTVREGRASLVPSGLEVKAGSRNLAQLTRARSNVETRWVAADGGGLKPCLAPCTQHAQREP
jgi:hypothetical protein